MRTSALLLLLLSLPAAAGRFDRFNSRTPQGRSTRGFMDSASLAFFEAFPASGAGTTSACSTTAPTGAKGETLTFTRASNGTCTKGAAGGLRTTSIADGDLVVLSSNVARVEYDSAGTLGLLVEAARTNSCLRSEEIDNATWANSASGAVAPTLNGANTIVAPDGTTTAEDYSFPATSGATFSMRSQAAACPAGGHAGTIFVKAIGSDFTTDLCVSNGATYVCATVEAVTGSWSRPVALQAGGAGLLLIGNASGLNGGIARSAGRLAIWGADCENSSAYATSYIPTAGIAVARAAEQGYFTMTASLAPAAGFSMATTLTNENVSTSGAAYVLAGEGGAFPSGSSDILLYYSGATLRHYTTPPSADVVTVAKTAVASARAASWCSSTASAAIWAGTASAAGAACNAGISTIDKVCVGCGSVGVEANAIVSRVCLDASPERCR